MTTHIQDHFAGWSFDDVIRLHEKEEVEKKRLAESERLRKISESKSKSVVVPVVAPSSVDGVVFPYQLQGVDGLLKFTEVSSDYKIFPDVVKWCYERSAVPVSPGEFLAHRIAQNGLNDTDKTVFTRCAVLYALVDNKFFALFDDVSDPDDNIVLKYFGKGVKDHDLGNFVLPRSDLVVRNAIDRAIAGERMLSLEGRTQNYTTHSLAPDSDGCDYSRILNPITGGDVADRNVDFLIGRKEKYTTGGIWMLTPEDLKNQGLAVDNVVVRLFRVGGIGNFNGNLDDVNASSDFDYYGRACGVESAKKFSTGNRGTA